MKLDFKPSDKRDPNPETTPEIITKAVETFGEDAQLSMAQEEAAELIAAINQWKRGRVSDLDLAGEVADVLITAVQVAEVLDRRCPNLVDSLVGQKLQRLKNRLGS